MAALALGFILGIALERPRRQGPRLHPCMDQVSCRFLFVAALTKGGQAIIVSELAA